MRISDWSSDVCSSDLCLNAYVEGEIANLFDWVENLEARSEHLMPHRGQFIVDIVEIDANAVHQPSKPGDEVVAVLNGILRLPTEADGDVQDILASEAVQIGRPACREEVGYYV